MSESGFTGFKNYYDSKNPVNPIIL
jgi:hypothetical protein